MTRDPRMDPQPGDVLLGLDGLERHVFRRNGDALQIGDATSSYRMRLDHWREWCGKSQAEVQTPNPEGRRPDGN
jgi:hypothetical protein